MKDQSNDNLGCECKVGRQLGWDVGLHSKDRRVNNDKSRTLCLSGGGLWLSVWCICKVDVGWGVQG